MLLSLFEAGATAGFQSDDFRWALISVLLSLPIIVLALCVHETAHGLVAYWLGDPTARNLGRLTLNPLKHLDLFGFLAMMVIGIGWAKPVPINTRNFKNPRWGMALSGIAGPVSNFLMALVCVLGYTGLYAICCIAGLDLTIVIIQVLFIFLEMGAYLNLALAVFNLIPVPPFDGSRFAYVLLPAKWYFKVMQYERYTGIIIMAALLICSYIGFNPIAIVVEFLLDLIFSLVFMPTNLLLSLILT